MEVCMDFVSFDFEIANHKRNSACSLGLAVVRNNQIVAANQYLIKPDPFYFDPFNVAIHGITPDMVANSPTMSELWPQLRPIFDGQLIVAHNAPFDISVLRRSLEQSGTPLGIKSDILCTYRLAQSAFPMLSSYRLDILCHFLGISLNHHEAVSDAVACAVLLCRLLKQADVDSLKALSRHFGIIPGYISNNYYDPCSLSHRNSAKTNDAPRDTTSVCIDEDFCGKNYVFTGTLVSMTREKAQEIVTRGGGRCQNSVSSKTNYLVMGIQDLRLLRGQTESTKTRKANELRNKGCDIQIIGEDDFLNMIDEELYALCMQA